MTCRLAGAPGKEITRAGVEHGESVPDALSTDNINNVEGIHLRAPPTGEYVVRVVARHVVQDARLDSGRPQ